MNPPLTAPEVSLIIPTFNEVGNVRALVQRLDVALGPVAWEVIFADDDSTDGTIPTLRQMALRDPRVRVLQRIGRRGLSSAVVEGILSTSSPYVVVMDADLQHDETILPRMLEALRSGGFDLVVGSRYTDGGGTGHWSTNRVLVSRLATRLATLVLRAPLTDPMSGYFALTRVVFDSAVRRLSLQGYKLLLDLFSSLPTNPRVLELPYTFRQRHSGQSKLDALVAWEYALLLFDKAFGRVVPVRFFMFALVGGFGILIHFCVLGLLHRCGGVAFWPAQAIATVAAMTCNFILNNLFTYRDQRVRGRGLILGLLSFYAVCGVGAVANVGVGSFVFGRHYRWWIAGAAGAFVGAVWNFVGTAAFTWRRQR